MKRVQFLGIGLPPRNDVCKACGAPILIGTDAFANDSHNPAMHCCAGCYLETFPHDPDAVAVIAGQASAPASPPASEDSIW